VSTLFFLLYMRKLISIYGRFYSTSGCAGNPTNFYWNSNSMCAAVDSTWSTNAQCTSDGKDVYALTGDSLRQKHIFVRLNGSYLIQGRKLNTVPGRLITLTALERRRQLSLLTSYLSVWLCIQIYTWRSLVQTPYR
jgi:hypothetical protein